MLLSKPSFAPFSLKKKYFDFSDNSKMLYTMFRSQISGFANSGWATFAEFTYDGGDDRMLFGIDTNQGFTVAMSGGRVRVSDFSAFRFGSSTGLTSGKYFLSCRYDGTTLKSWLRKDGSATVTQEHNINLSFTANRSGNAQIGGAFSSSTNSGLSRDPLLGKMYQCALWDNVPSEADMQALVSGSINLEDVSPPPLWYPDVNQLGQDKNLSVLTVKTFGDVQELSTAFEIDNSRILRDPETAVPVLFDAGSGDRYWMLYSNADKNSVFLATSTDLVTWSAESELFAGEGNELRASDFIYLGNIPGNHDPFMMVTISKTGASESTVHARTSSNMIDWSFSAITSSNALFSDTTRSSGVLKILQFHGILATGTLLTNWIISKTVA